MQTHRQKATVWCASHLNPEFKQNYSETNYILFMYKYFSGGENHSWLYEFITKIPEKFIIQRKSVTQKKKKRKKEDNLWWNVLTNVGIVHSAFQLAFVSLDF